MRLCPHFEVWRKEIPRRAGAGEGGLSHHEIKVPYCTHAQSPTTLEDAQHGLGEGAVLKCRGHVRSCLLPEDQRPRLEPRDRPLSEDARGSLEDAQFSRGN